MCRIDQKLKRVQAGKKITDQIPAHPSDVYVLR